MNSQINLILDIILPQWTLQILWVLYQHGKTRFNELKRKLDKVTPKVLTVRLRALEQQQIIIRTVRPAKIPEVSYQISPKGQALMPILIALHQVSTTWTAVEKTEAKPTIQSQIQSYTHQVIEKFQQDNNYLFKLADYKQKD